ncbi:MAG TPA: pyruvate dehydrogenase (acetyl-transferring) E1 component subunit alpha [Candidatus Angelobacter sp.]|nr:pyruvate dehydrogenase (acetyl-transferring) E1 component subunit alpha [Candidatus Angelobacter sp.]
MQTVAENEGHASADINQRLTPEEKIHLLEQMFRIRRFEQTALKYYQTGAMGGFLHLYIGQESVAIGTISLCGEEDQIIAGYRSHGQALAAGMSMNECMAELFGKASGSSKGKGGSMHLFAPDKNYWGGHGIVAGQTPLGLGLAFALKYKNVKGCCLCYLGDGAVNQGVYHESLNLASLWNLPVIYIIENNQYSMGTSIERSSAYKNCLAARAEGYNIQWDRINGESIYEIRALTWKAMERARNESRPAVLEIDTYRYYGHSVSDANAKKYRDPAEIEKYRQFHDPLRLWQRQLLAEGIITERKIAELDAAAQAEVDAAVDFAKASPLPDKADIFSDVYYEVDRQTHAGRTGKHFFND